MNIFNLFNGFRKKESQAAAQIIMLAGGSSVSPNIDLAETISEGFQNCVAAYACVSLISQSSSRVPWNLYRRQYNGKLVEPNDVHNHDLVRLWGNPNPFTAGTQYRESILAYLLITGNSYIEMIAPKTGKQIPKELWVLRPDRVTIKPGDSKDRVAYYIYKTNTAQRFPPESILHIKLFSPSDDWYGLSPISVGARAINTDVATSDWHYSLFKNKARMEGLLSAPKDATLDKTTIDQIINQIKDRRPGGTKEGDPLIVRGGFTWSAISFSPSELEFLEGKSVNLRSICSLYGVPAEMVGDSANKTYSNYREARKAFWTDACIPRLDLLRDEVNRVLVPMFGSNLYFDYDRDAIEVLREEQEKVWERISNADWLTVDEKREATGYGVYKPGKTIGTQIVNNNVPLGSTPPNIILPKDYEPLIKTFPDLLPRFVRDSDSHEVLNKFDLTVIGKAKNVISSAKLTEAVIKIEIERMKEVLNSIHKKVISGISGVSSPEDALSKLPKLGDTNDWNGTIKTLYHRVSDRSIRETIAGLPKAFWDYSKKESTEDVAHEALAFADRYIDENIAEKVKGINRTTREGIKSVIKRGIGEREGINDIKKRLDKWFKDDVIPYRSEVIARTETQAATNLGSQEAAKFTEVVTSRVWIPTIDDRSRGFKKEDVVDHISMASHKSIKMDKPWVLTRKDGGQPDHMMFPLDSSLGAAADQIIQCRCVEGFEVD